VSVSTAYINGEFAAVKAEEEGRQLATCDSSKNINVVENVVEKLSPQAMILLEGYSKKKREAATRLIYAIQDNPQITISEMTMVVGTTDRTIQRYLKEFQEAAVLKREGSDKKGQWILS